jgi:hypothetical protein
MRHVAVWKQLDLSQWFGLTNADSRVGAKAEVRGRCSGLCTPSLPLLDALRYRRLSQRRGLVPSNQSINKWCHQHLWSSLEPIWSRATVWRHGDINLTACFGKHDGYSESWHPNCALRRQKTKWGFASWYVWWHSGLFMGLFWLTHANILSLTRAVFFLLLLFCFVFVLFLYYLFSCIDDGLALFKRIIYIHSHNCTGHMHSVGKNAGTYSYHCSLKV